MTNNIAPFVPLMHEAKTVGVFRVSRCLGKNTIGQFFGEVSEICDGCAILSNVRIVKQRIVLRLLYCLLPLLVRRPQHFLANVHRGQWQVQSDTGTSFAAAK